MKKARRNNRFMYTKRQLKTLAKASMRSKKRDAFPAAIRNSLRFAHKYRILNCLRKNAFFLKKIHSNGYMIAYCMVCLQSK